MNKHTAFSVAGLVTVIIAMIVKADLKHFGDDMTTALIYWYMIWKLLHDKNKD